MEHFDTLVIGAGQAGLATGYHLRRSGASFTILEASESAGGSWPHYYASLRLFSPARFSALPGLPFPGDPESYPTRDQAIAYLRQYAAHFQLPVVTGARVVAVTHESNLFVVRTEDGRVFQSRQLIAATGSFHRPYLPELPDQGLFGGTLLHSFAYHDPAPFSGQRVIVVGGGNSAVQIATDLARVARVSLATREPVRFFQQRPFGRDIHSWWWLARLDTSPSDSLLGKIFGRLTAGKGSVVLDAGLYKAAIAAGMPDSRRMFMRFTRQGVVWDDQRTEAVDSVIFATGYRPNLQYLAPLGALDAEGEAIHHHGVSLKTPGLGFVGLSNQRTFASATLRGVGADAAVVLQQLRSLQRQPRTRTLDPRADVRARG